MRRPDLGTLRPGAAGDATIFSVKDGRFDYVDSVGDTLVGDRKIVSAGMVIGGRYAALPA